MERAVYEGCGDRLVGVVVGLVWGVEVQEFYVEGGGVHGCARHC